MSRYTARHRISPARGAANPIAMIASFGMALRYSFELIEQADMLDKAVANALDKGLRTKDIAAEGDNVVSTVQMGDAVIAELDELSA